MGLHQPLPPSRLNRPDCGNCDATRSDGCNWSADPSGFVDPKLAALFVHEEAQRVRMDAALQSVRQVESLGLIAGGVAHDFNNLLVSITGNAELAELFADSDPTRVREYLARIRRAGEQGADLARQLLTYAGHGSIALVPVDLNAVLTRTIEIRRASMPSNIAVQLDLTHNWI